jgi:carbonic anhydrase
MKQILNYWRVSISFIAATLLVAGCESPQQHGSAEMYPPARTRESQAAMSPQEALAELKAGNARFLSGRSQVRNLPAKVRATASGQYPFAVILSCLDSRQPLELIFDQGIGDVFNARVAGNVLNEDVLGSMEFGCKLSGAKLLVIVGHSDCGAVKGAIDGAQLSHLTGVLDRIKPAIAAVPDSIQPRDSKQNTFVQKVAEANVRLVMQQIRDGSPVLREMLDQKQIGMVGAMSDLKTGEVHFFPN